MTIAGLKIASCTHFTADITALLTEHLRDMHATSPAESVHALQHDELLASDMTFWVARIDGELAGCAALKWHADSLAELKSMRTSSKYRGKGVAKALLRFVLEQAKLNGAKSVKLETGSQDYFQPARSLYAGFGFCYTGPFADYKDDPNSRFMVFELTGE